MSRVESESVTAMAPSMLNKNEEGVAIKFFGFGRFGGGMKTVVSCVPV